MKTKESNNAHFANNQGHLFSFWELTLMGTIKFQPEDGNITILNHIIEAYGFSSKAMLAIHFETKGKRNRTVPISEELFNEIPKRRGQLFTPCYSAFRSAIKRANIELPHRQSSHVLRHTFASHFMMSGGNILVLQRILGHTDIKMTMRYSHFAPEHLNDALMFNPLVKLKI